MYPRAGPVECAKATAPVWSSSSAEQRISRRTELCGWENLQDQAQQEAPKEDTRRGEGCVNGEREEEDEDDDAAEIRARRCSGRRDTAGTPTLRCIYGRHGEDIPTNSICLSVGLGDCVENIDVAVAANGSSPH
ncbi:hypothetical protein DFH06DRAFT_1139840 [Mycena polygramma]|nr:hypothetical protein DFH06DRAFT_1139840 [Mycena polygramma]